MVAESVRSRRPTESSREVYKICRHCNSLGATSQHFLRQSAKWWNVKWFPIPKKKRDHNMTHYKDWRQWPTIVVKETSILCWVRFVASTICDSTIVNEAEPTLKESALPGRAFPQHLVRGDAGETTTRSTRNESWATLILISYSRVLTPLRRYACMANVIIMLISRTLGTRPWRKLLPYMSDQFPHPQDFKDSFVLTWIKWINLKATRHIGESGTLHVRSVSSPSRWIKKWKR